MEEHYVSSTSVSEYKKLECIRITIFTEQTAFKLDMNHALYNQLIDAIHSGGGLKLVQYIGGTTKLGKPVINQIYFNFDNIVAIEKDECFNRR